MRSEDSDTTLVMLETESESEEVSSPGAMPELRGTAGQKADLLRELKPSWMSKSRKGFHQLKAETKRGKSFSESDAARDVRKLEEKHGQQPAKEDTGTMVGGHLELVVKKGFGRKEDEALSPIENLLSHEAFDSVEEGVKAKLSAHYPDRQAFLTTEGADLAKLGLKDHDSKAVLCGIHAYLQRQRPPIQDIFPIPEIPKEYIKSGFNNRKTQTYRPVLPEISCLEAVKGVLKMRQELQELQAGLIEFQRLMVHYSPEELGQHGFSNKEYLTALRDAVKQTGKEAGHLQSEINDVAECLDRSGGKASWKQLVPPVVTAALVVIGGSIYLLSKNK